MEGHILRQLRDTHGITQTELAKELRVTQTLIGKWEREEVSASKGMIKAVAKRFNCSTDYLYGLEVNAISAREQKLLNEIKYLHPEEQDQFIEQITNMLKLIKRTSGVE